ncbi:MAG: hypothetical protein EBS68_02690 [Rhodobacteraceae bacterium]|nr:hypothetical protein [Paracoccaceae bacterium]
MAYETIIVEVEDYVALIRLNRPEALNALNAQVMSELAEAFTAAQNNEKVRCIVLTGSEKAFAAGADIKMMSEKSFTDVYFEDLFSPETEAMSRVRKPVIAAVAGYALGGGCELAMQCDFIIAADNAKFGQPEINIGVMAGIGGTQRLTRFIGTTLREGLLFERRVFHSLFATEDQKEGMAAFTEKRSPQFRDR